MAAIRRNIMFDIDDRDKFLRGMVMLAEEPTEFMAQDVLDYIQSSGVQLPMSGIDQSLTTYDLFVFWHIYAMNVMYSTGNAAHGGPVFLPWHRMYLIRLEQNLQRVLNDRNFGLPYWDWAEDGELSRFDQIRTDLWSANYIGEPRGRVRSGLIGRMRVKLLGSTVDNAPVLFSISPRRLERRSGLSSHARGLPNQDDVAWCLNQREYDRPPWSRESISHRNILEGWIDGPQLHNLVHVWIGGDMGPGTSPNDPVFFLNHCNVDRIWESWMAENGRTYRPSNNEGTPGHRLDDLMVSILADPMTPAQVLDPSDWYSYDNLVVI